MNEWDDVWSKVEKPTFIGRSSMKRVFNILEGILSTISVQTALDVGCGGGFALEFLNKRIPHVVGIDFSRVAVKRCKNKGFSVIQMDAREMSFKNKEADLIFSWGLLEHFSDFTPFVEEMGRVSRRYVVLVQPNVHSFYGKMLFFFTNILGRGVSEYPYHIEDFVEAFEEQQFKLIYRKGTTLKEFEVLVFENSEKP